MDNTLRSYLTEAIFSNVSQETFFEEDETDDPDGGDKLSDVGSKRLSSVNSFQSIAYIDDDIEIEIAPKARDSCSFDETDVYSVIDDEVFKESDPSTPTDSTSESEGSFRTAPNTLSREDGVNINKAISSGSLLKDEKYRSKKSHLFASVGDIMTNISPAFTRKLSLRRLRGRKEKYSDPGPSDNSDKCLTRSQSTKSFRRSKDRYSYDFKINKNISETQNQNSGEIHTQQQDNNRKTSFNNGIFYRKIALKRTLTSSSINTMISNLNRTLSFRSKQKRRSQSCRSLRPTVEQNSKFYHDQHIADENAKNAIRRRYFSHRALEHL